MSEKPIDKLESQLETLIEGAFARLFRRTINARDIAVILLREMEDNLKAPTEDDPHHIAPDQYIIYLHHDTVKKFVHAYPDLSKRLSSLIVDLSTQSGYRLRNKPSVKILADSQLSPHKVTITADHATEARLSTAAMNPVDVNNTPDNMLKHPRLVIGDLRTIQLSKSLINIGREDDNDIVIEDAYISRHHLQLRKRFGSYMLFDVHSSGGTKVNETLVREHRLQNGDVIQIGHTRLIYTDDTDSENFNDPTQSLDPI